jgi:hypothetical protein
MAENPAQDVGPQAQSRLSFDRVHAQPRCQRCGYNLHSADCPGRFYHRALVRCPECGLAAYALYEHPPRQPAVYSNPLGVMHFPAV